MTDFHNAFCQVFIIFLTVKAQNTLTLSRRRPLSYRNHSIDLLRKSMDWFLYDNRLRLERVNEIYFPAETSNINTRSSFQRLKQPFRKSNKGLNSASYSGQSLWNKLPVEIKRSGVTNSFKHNVKIY